MSFAIARSTTATAIGGLFADVLNRQRVKQGTPHRTGASVRRDSLEAGTFEEGFFAVPVKGEADKLTRAAGKLLDEGRRLKRKQRGGEELSVAERAVAAMTAAAVRVYQEFCTLWRVTKGQLYPSYDYLAERTELGRRTVARAIVILEKVGLLIRQRRFARVEAEGAGPRWHQTSNVYRPVLAKALMTFLPRSMRPAPPPVDEIQREADRQEDTQHMLAGLNCRELARATLVSGPLADVVAKLGACIDARSESADMALNR
ncbi:Helix-turn-helix domain-containing protein [Sphingomonas gellani]|uniref:Helix-turn-helix domain-containing protein n=1 Tax=Sphingomonas gellani TaxID=1166340 RepID=A0A1H8AUY7_9SPHN|nr:helix-turn-helix domain-containing protein [Sphingomonas gellani]SEM73764.1 Helix-turn-helix domain-containing protein [Sphingomonas gellani]